MAKTTLDKFAKFNDLLDKKAKTKVDLRGFSDISDYIPTGNYLLNAQISGSLFGGYPNTRSFCLAGESGSGKTYLALNAAREAQLKDYLIVYIDTEGALDTDNFVNFGVNLEQLNYKRFGLINDVKFYLTDLIELKKENPELKMMIVLDSISLLEANKFKDDASRGHSAVDMGLRAKDLRAMFRALTLDLSSLGVPLIFTSHISPSSDKYTPDSMGGGKGAEYSASGIVYMYKSNLWSDDKDAAKEDSKEKIRTGTRIRSKVMKSRLAKPVNIEIHVSFIKGMNPFVGLQEYISWETCGLEKGKKINEKEYSKLKPEEQEKCHAFEVKEIVGNDLIKTELVKYYILPSVGARNYINKWTGDSIPTRELFSARAFTEKVLLELDKNVIQPTFKYASREDAVKAEMEELELATDTNEE
jgi:RecA/RadA recombinase